MVGGACDKTPTPLSPSPAMAGAAAATQNEELVHELSLRVVVLKIQMQERQLEHAR